MFSTKLSKGDFHIDDLVDIRLQLEDCVTLPIERTNSNLTHGCCFSLACNLADIVIVDGLGRCHVCNRAHLNYASHFELVGVVFHVRFHGLHIPCIHLGVKNLPSFSRNRRWVYTCTDIPGFGTKG